MQALEDIDDDDPTAYGDHSEREERRAEVTNEVIDGFDIDLFVDIPGFDPDQVGPPIQMLSKAMEALREQGLRVPSTEDLQDQIIDMNRPVGTGPLPKPQNRPDKERQARREKLSTAARKTAGRIIHSMNIPKGDDLVSLIGKGEESNNYEVVIRTFNRRLNKAMGKDGSNSRRNDWLLDEFKEAERRLSEVEDELIAFIEANTSYRRERPNFGFF